MEVSQNHTKLSYLLTTFVVAFVLSLPVSALALTRNVKYYGAKGNGIANDTAAIQKAINAAKKGDIVYFPSGKYMIDAKVAIRPKSNMKLLLHKYATLAAIPNDAERHYVIALIGVTNVEIGGGRILGERNKHKGTEGEWGYGINVGRRGPSGGTISPKPCSYILIRDIHISKMWGDGIQVGGGSHNIVIKNVVATRNRRQGLSITNARKVKVLDSEFSYTQGTAPAYGIDIEPDPGDGRYAEDIMIQGNTFHHNSGGGLLIYKETYDITVRWNKFNNNTFGMYTVSSNGGKVYGNEFKHNVYDGLALKGLTSNYTVENNIFRNNSTKAVGFIDYSGPLITIKGLKLGKNGTYSHIDKGDNTKNVRILTNRYAR